VRFELECDESLEAGALPSMGMGWVGNRPIPVGRSMEEEGPLLGLRRYFGF
jgi:hypothetical protein